ncbi:hypothetical protein SLA2020_312100 [Shorea laevis]
MATLSAPRRGQELRSGGKMVRPRRTTLTARTPYDRPSLVNSVVPERSCPLSLVPSLRSLLLLPSSSFSGSDAISDDVDDNENDNYLSSQGAENFAKREPQTIARISETKCLIERLLMQETFSREEGDRLTNIIKSRVVETGRSNETPIRTTDNVVDTAVKEARKWLEEKKSGSSSKSDLHHETRTLNYAMLPLGSEGEAGSPVDMAKSYMRTRPPWASPSMSHIEHRSPSPIQMHIFKELEGTPYSIAGNSLSSSKLKRGSPTTSSWNIHEELRKVRSKATEEMLRSRPSSKIDWSSFALEYKSGHALMFSDRLGAGQVHEIPSSTKSVDASLNFAAGPVSELTQDLLLKDALPNPATLNSEQNEGTEAFLGIKRTGDETLDVGQRLKSSEDIKTVSQSDANAADVDQLKETETSQQLNSTIRETIQDSRTPDKNCSISEPAGEMGGGGFTANGSRSAGFSLSAVPDGEQDHRPREKEANTAGLGHAENANTPVGETCELLSEASVEVPIVNENDGVATGSQNSYEGSSEDLSQPNSKRRKKNNGVEPPLGMKLRRPSKRGRGRGR